MVGVCELAKILASNGAIKYEVEKLQKNISSTLKAVNVVSSPEISVKIKKCMIPKSKISFKGIEGITDKDVRIIKSNIKKFKDGYYLYDTIEFEKCIVNYFFDGRCDVCVKDQYVIEVKTGEDKSFHLVQLALYNIFIKENIYGYIFNPIEGYVYGGNISSLCNKIKEVVDDNYVFLNFDGAEGGIASIGNLFTKESVSEFDIIISKVREWKTIIMDRKNYNPDNNPELEKIIDDYRESFIFFNKDVLGN